MDDIRETIINYEDEGGGERDTGKRDETHSKLFAILIFIIIFRLRLECITGPTHI